MAHSHVLGNATETHKHKRCSHIPVRHTHTHTNRAGYGDGAESGTKTDLLCLAVCGSVGVCGMCACASVRQLCVPTCNKYL